MAIKKQIEIDVDTKSAVKSMEELGGSFEDVYGEVQPLSGRIGELEDRLYEMAAAGDTTSDEFKQLTQEVGKMKKVIVDTDLSVDAMSQTMAQNVGGALGGLTGAFELGQGAMGAFGVESEKVEETLLKVQSAMAISQGLQSIKESVPAFRAMGKSAMTALKGIKTGLAATGIGVFLIALGAVASNWDKITKALGVADEAQQGLNASMDSYRDGVKEAVKVTNKVEQAFNQAKKGVISKKEALKVYNTELGGTFGTAKNLNEAEELFIEKTAAYIKAAGLRAKANKLAEMAAEEEAKALTASVENQVGLTDVMEHTFSSWENFTGTMLGGTKKAQETAIELQKKGVKEAEDAAQRTANVYQNAADEAMAQALELEAANEIKNNSDNNYTSNASSNAEKLAELKRQQTEEARQQELEQEAIRNEALDRIAQAQYEATTSAAQQEIDTVREKYFELISLAQQYGQDTKALEEAQAAELAEIKATREAERLAKEQEVRAAAEQAEADRRAKNLEDEQAHADQIQAIKQQGFESTMQGLQALDDLNSLLTDAAVKKAGDNEAAAEKARKKGFERSKKLQLTMAIIQGVQGVMAAFTAGSSMGPAGVVMGPLMAALAAVTAGINVAKISQMKYEGGGASTGGGSIGAAPSPASVPNPANFNVVGDSGTNQLAESLGQQPPVQAYVVGSEVTTQQSLDRNKVETASI